MNLINEICTVVILIIVIHIIFIWIENKIYKDIALEKINKIKNILVLVIGILLFSNLLDIYNILIKDTNAYIHILGIFSFAKINTGYISVMFIFEIGQFAIYLEIIMLLILKSKKTKIISTIFLILLYSFLCIYKLYNPYMFYRSAEIYDNIYKFDLKADFRDDNKVSKEGAIKIIKEQYKFDYIKDVKAELIKLDDVEDTVIKYSCDFEEFWIINFDYMKNFEIYENVCVYIDIKTGEMSYITY